MAIVCLETAADTFGFDCATGRLRSLRARSAPEVELLDDGDHPALALHVLHPDGRYECHDSSGARRIAVETAGIDAVTCRFEGLAGLDLDVTITAASAPGDRFSRWTARVENRSGVDIVDLQFPFVVIARRDGMEVLDPAAFGSLYRAAAMDRLPEDQPALWQLRPENGSSPHYPGRSFAQFLAACAPVAGLYLACTDDQANVKLFRPVRRGRGVRLGVAHVGDWPTNGGRTLEYETLLGSFQGDWYDAAELYRAWGLRQRWATPLTRRTDIPAWLLDSPPHITIRLQGYLDDGPAPAIDAFLPYEKCIPLLEGVADRLGAPLVAVLMSWERGGPWVYPDCFPPVGGDASLARFTALARERGWRVGSFCNGTRWVTQHLYNGYDGREYFERLHGAETVCRLADGGMWPEGWDQGWRPSYTGCMGQERTREIATSFVGRLLSWGMESVQFFDQNCNAATFLCFGESHGHPRIPGKWMARAMAETVAAFRRLDSRADGLEVIHSTEMPCNETCLPHFQQSDLRVSAPTSGLDDFVPVYHYLYHECAILHGMMSFGPEPYSLPMRSAWNGVLGEIPGGVLTGDGTLLNRDTINWALWEPKVGSSEDAFEMMRTITALRRGAGRAHLVYGRMQRPAEVDGIETLRWEWNGKRHEAPAIAHAAWTAPDGRHGVVLANWTDIDRTVSIADPRLSPGARAAVVGREEREEPFDGRVTVPALGCALIA